MYAAIEAGGTKFRCALGVPGAPPLAEARIATRTPHETLADVGAFFDDAIRHHGRPRALGVATFGPVCLDPSSPHWGCLLDTPKRGWSGADLAGPLGRRLQCPVAIDTDVNAAALAECDARALDSLVYVTVGTGVGAGIVHLGRPVHGLLHPELGHARIRRPADDDAFAGVCPFHGDCIEGLASGPAIVARWGAPLAALASDHPARSLLARYLGELAALIALAASPRALVFGGGVMDDGSLLPGIRVHAARALAGYVQGLRGDDAIATWIDGPRLGADSGLAGAFELAGRCALSRSTPAPAA